MFSVVENSGHEELDGRSDEKPICLDGISREMFELFLEHTFGRYVVIISTNFELLNLL